MGRLTPFIPALLVAAGTAVALALLAPHRSEPLVRADGAEVKLLRGLDHTSDAWDYLQVGRQLATGQGFTSRFTYVPFLPESVPQGGGAVSTFPVFWRQPGYPVMVAAALRVTGRNDPNALLWAAGLGVALLPWAAYLLARRMLSPGWAVLAAVWTLSSPVALGEDASLVATTWFVVLVTLLFAAALAARKPVGWLGVGLLLGASALLRLETWFLIPGLFLVRRSAPHPVRSTLVIVGVAVLLVLPWHLRLQALTGSPVYNAGSLLFHDTPPFPGWDASRTLAVRDLTVRGFLHDHPGAVLRKTGLDIARFARDLVLLPSPFLAVLFWLGVLRPAGERVPRGLAFGAAAACVVLVLALAPMEHASRFLAPLVPLFAVSAAHTLARLPRYRGILAGTATLVGLALVLSIFPRGGEQGSARTAALDMNRLMALPEAAPLTRDAVALGDCPTVYAWIWDRPAVWAPLPRDLPRVRALLPGSMGMFTRAGGLGGDSLSPTTVTDYASLGGKIIGEGLPVLIVWPRMPPSGAAP